MGFIVFGIVMLGKSKFHVFEGHIGHTGHVLFEVVHLLTIVCVLLGLNTCYFIMGVYF